MDLASESNDHRIENAIPVCFDCHAEIHAYNPSHPRGRKFTTEELKGHKENWLRICAERPEVLILASREVDTGPIQGMLDELEYNLLLASNSNGGSVGFLLRDEQLVRAIREGVMSFLHDDLRSELTQAYGAISRANELVRRLAHVHESFFNDSKRVTSEEVISITPVLTRASEKLRAFLKSETEVD